MWLFFFKPTVGLYIWKSLYAKYWDVESPRHGKRWERDEKKIQTQEPPISPPSCSHNLCAELLTVANMSNLSRRKYCPYGVPQVFSQVYVDTKLTKVSVVFPAAFVVNLKGLTPQNTWVIQSTCMYGTRLKHSSWFNVVQNENNKSESLNVQQPVCCLFLMY